MTTKPDLWPHPTYIELEKQVEELRAALEKIANSGNVNASWLIAEAKAALERDKDG
jgi:hypothetical protein